MYKKSKHDLVSGFIFKYRGYLKQPHSLDSHEDGATITEFALVAPLFIIAIFAAIQLGLMMVVQNALETAAREAGRYAITGQSSGSRSADINSKVYRVLDIYSAGIIKPGDVVISVKAYPNLQNIGKPEPFTDLNKSGAYDKGEVYSDINGNGTWDADQGISNSFGISGQAVLYEISYVWDTIFPIFGTSSKITLKGRTPVVNEDY